MEERLFFYNLNMRDLDPKVKTAILTAIVIIFTVFFTFVVALLYRKKRIIPFLKIIACSAGGLNLIVILFASSWTELEELLLIQIGQECLPSKVRLGFECGLRKIKMYMECPASNKPRHQLFKQEMTLGNEEMLHKQYLSALEEGWEWPLLYIASHLGGEKYGWKGILGECLSKASNFVEPFVIGSIFIWFFWCISCKISPSKSLVMMLTFGISLIVHSILYASFIHFSCPKMLLPDGRKFILKTGWCVKLTGGTGVCLTLLGLCMSFAKPKEIRRLSTKPIIKDSRESRSHNHDLQSLSAYQSKVESICNIKFTSENMFDKERALSNIDENFEKNSTRTSIIQNKLGKVNIDEEIESMSPTSLSTMFVL